MEWYSKMLKVATALRFDYVKARDWTVEAEPYKAVGLVNEEN
jgi:hypothetical protein